MSVYRKTERKNVYVVGMDASIHFLRDDSNIFKFSFVSNDLFQAGSIQTSGADVSNDFDQVTIQHPERGLSFALHSLQTKVRLVRHAVRKLRKGSHMYAVRYQLITQTTWRTRQL